MPTVRIQEKNYSESIMVLKLKDGRFRSWGLRCFRDIISGNRFRQRCLRINI